MDLPSWGVGVGWCQSVTRPSDASATPRNEPYSNRALKAHGSQHIFAALGLRGCIPVCCGPGDI